MYNLYMYLCMAIGRFGFYCYHVYAYTYQILGNMSCHLHIGVVGHFLLVQSPFIWMSIIACPYLGMSVDSSTIHAAMVFSQDVTSHLYTYTPLLFIFHSN